MVHRFLILILTAPFVPHQVICANTDNTTEAAYEAAVNLTSTSPKETSYFYRDPQGSGTYEFGYHIEDEKTENIQFRKERKYSNGTVVGSYGYLRADGKMVVVNYIADENGFRTKKKLMKHTSSSSSAPGTTPPTAMTTEIPVFNLTSGTLPPQLVREVMDKFQIDLSPDASPNDILHPNISDIINGKIEMKTDKNSSQLGFNVVHNFIPSQFPIAPFHLPNELPMPGAPNND